MNEGEKFREGKGGNEVLTAFCHGKQQVLRDVSCSLLQENWGESSLPVCLGRTVNRGAVEF